MKKINIFAIILFSAILCSFSKVNAEIPKKETSLSFKENKGQVGDQFSKPRPDILFTGSSGSLVFHLRNNGISYQMYRVDKWKENSLPDHSGNERTEPTLEVPDMKSITGRKGRRPEQTTVYRLDINWLNANSNASVLKENALQGYDNYYSEVCPNGVTGVKSYKNVTYQNLYNGINLKWYAKDENLKYDYIVAAGVDYKQIQLEIKGAENISVNENGELIIKAPLGTLTEKAPYVTQNGKTLKAKWIINNHTASFDIAGVDATKPLVIDPLVRLWGTYYGGNDDDGFYGSAIDASGNIYVSGDSYSQNNIATIGAHQTILGDIPLSGSGDAMLAKFNSAGVRLWGTYYGGDGEDYGNRCAVDATGNYIAMAGTTTSTLAGVIATPGSHQSNYGGTGSTLSYYGDAYLAVFNGAGVRQWGTYYGGSAGDWGGGCDFDPNGDVYVSGGSYSAFGIASPGAHQTANGLSGDGFLAKFNNSGVQLWGTYYGGSGWDFVDACQCDASGNIFITGCTLSKTGISTPGAIQPALAGPYFNGDGMIVKFNSSGVRQWGTYYGDAGFERAFNCDFDADGNIYVAGLTTPRGDAAISYAVCTPGAHQTTCGGSDEAFLLKLTPAGTRIWCTFYGGKGNEEANRCYLDPSGNIYLIGCTSSTSAISTACSYQINYGGSGPLSPFEGGDSYMAKFKPDGTRLWGTYFGDIGSESYCIASIDYSGNVYLAGSTSSSAGTVISTNGSHQDIYGGGPSDAFLVKFDGCIPNAQNTTNPPSLTICSGKSTALTTNVPCNVGWYNVPVGDTAIGNTPVFATPILTTTTTFYVNDGSCGSNTVRTAITVTVHPLPLVTVNIPSITLCYAASVNLIASGANSYTWSPETAVSCVVCSNPVVSPTEDITYCVSGTDNNSCVGTACSTIEVNSSHGHNFSLPNAFTPNGDGKNDSFCLQGWDECNDHFHVMIFDRWGEKVYESTDPNFCWNGIYNGQLLSGDVYVFKIEAKYLDKTEINKKGNITLIR